MYVLRDKTTGLYYQDKNHRRKELLGPLKTAHRTTIHGAKTLRGYFNLNFEFIIETFT